MATANDILNVARAEVGTVENPRNSNNIKYNTWYYGREVSGGSYPYCVVFVAWVFNKANAFNLFNGGKKVALCSALYNYHKGKGQAVSVNNLTPGCIVFYDFSGAKKATSHVGIVESVSGSNIVAIEGNTSSGSSGSQSNGDGVYRRTRAIKYVSCAYRPAYDDAPASKGIPTDIFVRWIQRLIGAAEDGEAGTETYGKCPLLKTTLNQTHPAVYAAQVYLMALGYDIGKDGADGVYGGDTARAVAAYQKDHGLTADGEIGGNTWKKILS